MYKSNEIPNTFDKIVDFSDNYIVFSEEDKLNSGTSYEVYIQYFKPHFYVLHLEDYRITKGDNYSLEFNYTNNNGIDLLDSIDYSYTLNTYTTDTDTSSDLKDTADYIDILIGGTIGIAIFLYLFKNLSRLFFKGGIV